MSWSSENARCGESVRLVEAAVVLLLGLCGGNCGGGVEAVLVRLDKASCDVKLLEELRSVQVVVRGKDPLRGPCMSVRVKTLEELQTELARNVRLGDLPAGEVTLTVLGYDGSGCKSDDAMLCGTTALTLPVSAGSVSVPLLCHRGSSPPASFTSCAGL
ncbi:MAG: hypothetical protein IT371_16790 [Deltaproteobacteria bacterium]|nr:hypothetical protein [Deltaproteobacteria bacterium]